MAYLFQIKKIIRNFFYRIVSALWAQVVASMSTSLYII